MKTGDNLRKEREDLKDYLSEINYDGMFFKGQMILGGILVCVFLIYLLWL